ncbi:MAG: GHKL domain-containing protein, partial [Nitrosopumilaceae archaeon]|nr:HAMP domain-containing histidine kinase [Nitrosopumilaceae archaeon]NIU87033.1 GHKL domain-containing protein [Nitrosopumilaceae archaeon]NIV65613.1 GHKL domain-containing protein [Nitrosopumilaceae archaeon]NIX61261.1 GHKL domain-containing protein [Nitrosopumilaceae archaeon]
TDMRIPCDERKMEAVFSNLLANSVSALDGPGEVDIEFSSNNDSYIITVKDSGPGIPEEQLVRIFEPLYTTKKTGTGLGLVICKSIIEQHGGTILASNKPTTFTITLPKE